MTLDEMKLLYTKTMGAVARMALTTSKVFTLRVWDGMDGCWSDVVANVDLGFAMRKWCECTKNGTEHTKYDDIDYYKIFAADTKMLWADDFTMRDMGEDDR